MRVVVRDDFEEQEIHICFHGCSFPGIFIYIYLSCRSIDIWIKCYLFNEKTC